MRTKPATDNCRHRLRERPGRIIGNLGVYDLLSLFATRTCFLAFAKRVGITLDKTMYLTRHGRKAEWGTTVPPIWLEGVPPTQELYTHTHTHTHTHPESHGDFLGRLWTKGIQSRGQSGRSASLSGRR